MSDRFINGHQCLVQLANTAQPLCTVSAYLLEDPAMRLFAIEDTLLPMPDIATLRTRKTDPFKGYNFLAARAGSPLLDRISQGFANAAPPS